jgi:hypothetical protein
MSKLIAALAVVSVLGFASSAFAAPVQLSEVQLDQVTAGSSLAVLLSGGTATGTVGEGVLTIGYTHTTKNSATAVGGTLAVAVGKGSASAAVLAISATK